MHANALQRIKIAGQIINSFQGEYFLMQQTNGLRFKPIFPLKLQPGDLVEVVGFPSMDGAFPYLHEAIVRRTGKAELPEACFLRENGVLNSKLDSTLVRVTARVLSISIDQSEQKLELQAGKRVFVARLERQNGIIQNVSKGSLVEIKGTCVGLDSNQAFNNHIDSFQILLQSPSDLRVISQPPWWTPQHTITVVCSLGLIILSGMVWITLLRQQVTERSERLANEIKDRQKAEHYQALEEERFRIARDLHDDLGATLTQIRFLSALGFAGESVPDTTREQLKQISEKSRQMVGSLDEIVWAVNPRNDSLRSLAAYLRHVAEELFAKTTIKCRLNIEKALPDVPITSTVRHNLYLAVKEALNNCAKHSNATELWLHIHWKEQELKILIEDNGCGFSESEIAVENNGLLNMKERLKKIGGRFECETRQGSGTVCRMSLYIA